MNFTIFIKSLSQWQPCSIVFAGLGNENRGDDAAGLIFCNRLKKTGSFKGAHFVLAGTNPENHLDEIIGYSPELVVFIDAARFGGKPGDIKWLESADIKRNRISTHAFSMEMVEKYLFAHQPMQFKYLGIEPLATEPYSEISPQVLAAVDNFFNEAPVF